MEKKHIYEQLLPQMAALIEGETEEMSVLANVAALLKDRFGWFWTGFYLVRDGELRVGPFQGPVACMHIARGRGVCGSAWQQRQTIVVDDVERFPGHIACSSLSRSEIVVPIFRGNGDVAGVIDVDSTELSTFDDTDAEGLQQVAQLIAKTLYQQ
ncbi:MAG: GAF domain-containing protein [Bacteroidaceae bacterium]|nr:GAF domain-containing protein [Bacteroidaceae bacterium]MBQ9645692.1 GAF domain-containing protein [Prevotella sp.]